MLAPLSGAPHLTPPPNRLTLSPVAALLPAATIGVSMGAAGGNLAPNLMSPPVARPRLPQLAGSPDASGAHIARKGRVSTSGAVKGKHNARLEAALPAGVDLLESDLRGYTIKCDSPLISQKPGRCLSSGFLRTIEDAVCCSLATYRIAVGKTQQFWHSLGLSEAAQPSR
jgi:hypothetical protein